MNMFLDIEENLIHIDDVRPFWTPASDRVELLFGNMSISTMSIINTLLTSRRFNHN